MSTVTDVAHVQIESPKSIKKRKAESDASSKSSKKRKQEVSEVESTSLSHSSSIKEDRRKEKKNKKGKEDKNRQREVGQQPEAELAVQANVEDGDIELPDAPLNIPNPAAQTAQTNGDAVSEDMEITTNVDSALLQSEEPTCFYSKRMSLYVSIPAISLTSSTSSILSLHLSPLLLTYFPPAEGIVLSFSNPVISAKADSAGVNLPIKPPAKNSPPQTQADEIFARCADGFGVSWVWLTATFLIFKPRPGDSLRGWTNVQSEGFIGLVSYNYFQTAVGKARIPKAWRWDGPSQEQTRRKRIPKKGKLRDDVHNHRSDDLTSSQVNGVQEDDENFDDGTNAFVDANGEKVRDLQVFKVVDIEMVPGHERDRFTLQIDGSLLSEGEENAIRDDERRTFEAHKRSRTRSQTPGFEDDSIPLMSGGLPPSHEAGAI